MIIPLMKPYSRTPETHIVGYQELHSTQNVHSIPLTTLVISACISSYFPYHALFGNTNTLDLPVYRPVQSTRWSPAGMEDTQVMKREKKNNKES